MASRRPGTARPHGSVGGSSRRNRGVRQPALSPRWRVVAPQVDGMPPCRHTPAAASSGGWPSRRKCPPGEGMVWFKPPSVCCAGLLMAHRRLGPSRCRSGRHAICRVARRLDRQSRQRCSWASVAAGFRDEGIEPAGAMARHRYGKVRPNQTSRDPRLLRRPQHRRSDQLAPCGRYAA
jgi:hypothetical protein